MRKIIERFIAYPIYANLLIALVLVAGGVSMISMNKSFFPEVESRMITVSVFYPGASPVEMEEGVTSRIEEAIRGIIGIKEINSTSLENSARVNIETTGEYDINEILMEVKNAVDGISSLPTAAERPIVAKQRSRAMALSLNVVAKKGQEVDLMTLKKHAQRIEEDFYNSGSISQITLSGYPQLEISVEISEEDLLRYNLTFDQIIRAIQNNNQDISGGQIRSDDEELLIRLRSRSSSPDKIGDIILKGNADGSFLRIRDVALVKKKFAENSNKSWVNGQPAVTISIEKLPEEDLEAITDFARSYMEDFNSADKGAEIVMSRAYLDILRNRLSLLTTNGSIGLVLVIIALGLFLSFRLSLWVAFGIPFSFLAMFIFAQFIGVTINMMSIFGMILVIGILVDDGIVIAENIYLHFERGKTPMKAALDGTMEVMPAVMTSVVTTIIAFAPLLFLTGTRMEMMFEMSLVVIAALAFSLFEAFLVLPAHLGNGVVLNEKKRNRKNRGIKKYSEGFIVWLRDNIYEHSLKWLIRWRWAVFGIPIAMVLVTVGLFLGGHIKNTFFPMVDFDRFAVNVAFTPGDGEKTTYSYLQNFEKAIWAVNEDLKKELDQEDDIIERINTNLGTAFSGQESGAHAGSISVFPRDLEGLPISGYDIANKVRMKIGQVPQASKFTVGGRNRWGAPISIGLLSQNLEELDQAKVYLMERLNELPQLKDITENVALGKQEVRLDLKQKAYFLGLDENTIARQVRQGFYGGQAQRLQEGRDELRIWVRYPLTDRLTLGQMERMKIKTAFGEYPLIELADYHLERGPVAINHYNGSREIRVEAETVDPLAPVPEIIDQINSDILPNLLGMFPGVSYVYQGQQKASNEALQKVMQYFLIAFILIIFVMVLHFKSGWQTLIVIMMIPLAMLGVLWGHGIHGKAVSIMSFWGMIALTGVIINDAIVFLSKYDGLLVEGKKVTEAVVEAGKLRLRPILLTSITTTIGLFPMILEKSVQAQFLVPMAISLAYGVAIGTVFILIFFPVLIMILNDLKILIQRIWTGVAPEREAVEIAVKNAKKKKEFLTQGE
ncbi:MAG: efflux RND transporter permease subunit [Bacteroidetes bacterium]|jgi:multidrug efflux pump subunit AcrB|nr:efflux RND transporter permease subunit [Bacteroidota bacterium]MBT3747629.1 efflux RND transporter permease subunit [Bacteroidota bacterium]MBT4399107.1 efflux RND transporter permease subunit [Bacteroidota bacterium]MBT7092396.1 efflux RND transporter permease subunit [Bacteroidota bacterium]MBT7465130.1 efflux RND transporter permease subunit [Bacteroidota bacterium]